MNSLAGQVNVTGLGIFASLAQLGIEGRISRITLPPVYTPSCVAPPATFLGLIGERTRMFRSPVAAAAPQSDQDVLITPDELVPLSVLGLDLGVGAGAG